MNSFGGTPVCPRCETAVYAAEQVMGPARKIYHKPCLKCTLCNKRLDSGSLLEHDSDPYCRPCHLRQFSTKNTHNYLTQSFSATPPTTPPRVSIDSPQVLTNSPAPVVSPTGRGWVSSPSTPDSKTGSFAVSPPKSMSPLSARYQRAMNTGTAGLISPMSTGSSVTSAGGTPRYGGVRVECPRCHKAVYFAEQVNAVGKKWHKQCLKCTKCSTGLDSTKLVDKEGEPFCKSCYSKDHAQESGYVHLR